MIKFLVVWGVRLSFLIALAIPIFSPFIKTSLNERRSRIPVTLWVPSFLSPLDIHRVQQRVTQLFSNQDQYLFKWQVLSYGQNQMVEEDYDELLGHLINAHEGFHILSIYQLPSGLGAAQFQARLKDLEVFKENRLWIDVDPSLHAQTPFLRIVDVFLPHVNFVGDPSYASLTLAGRGRPREKLSVEVVAEISEHVLNSKIIEIESDENGYIFYPFTFEFTFSQVGTHTVDFKILSASSSSVTFPPSKASFVAFVAYSTTYLLHLAVSPDWTVRMMRSYLQASSSIETITYLILRHLNNFLDIPSHKLSLIEFPSKELFEEKLNSFHGALFQNVSFDQYLTPEQIQSVLKYIKGGGRILQFLGPSSFERSGPTSEVLSPCENIPKWVKRDKPIVWQPVETDLVSGYDDFFYDLKKLKSYYLFENCHLKKDVQVLARTDTQDPLIVFQHFDQGVIGTIFSPDWLDLTSGTEESIHATEHVLDWFFQFLQRRHDAAMQAPTISSQHLSVEDQGLLIHFRGGANTTLKLDLIHNQKVVASNLPLTQLKNLNLLAVKLPASLSELGVPSHLPIELGWQLSGTEKKRLSSWTLSKRDPLYYYPQIFGDVPQISQREIPLSMPPQMFAMNIWLSFFEVYPWWWFVIFSLLACERWLSLWLSDGVFRKKRGSLKVQPLME